MAILIDYHDWKIMQKLEYEVIRVKLDGNAELVLMSNHAISIFVQAQNYLPINTFAQSVLEKMGISWKERFPDGIFGPIIIVGYIENELKKEQIENIVHYCEMSYSFD